MFARHAMRYYRLWIYSCNVALLLAVILFASLAVNVLADYRLSLLPSLGFHDPSFVYACVALALQGGLLQALGCWAAIKMNERLLNVYWTIMLGLLIGDVVLGIVWLFRFHGLTRSLRSELRARLDADYGLDAEFELLWNRLQAETQCCGVNGPLDFNGTWWQRREPGAFVPGSCCRNGVQPCRVPYSKGCVDIIYRWMQHHAEMLAVVGFCVIAFLKVCFLAILRYEIKEMIQKIQILREMDKKAAFLARPCEVTHWFPNQRAANGNNNDPNVKKASLV